MDDERWLVFVMGHACRVTPLILDCNKKPCHHHHWGGNGLAQMLQCTNFIVQIVCRGLTLLIFMLYGTKTYGTADKIIKSVKLYLEVMIFMTYIMVWPNLANQVNARIFHCLFTFFSHKYNVLNNIYLAWLSCNIKFRHMHTNNTVIEKQKPTAFLGISVVIQVPSNGLFLIHMYRKQVVNALYYKSAM